jgi:hypothetical protein
MSKRNASTGPAPRVSSATTPVCPSGMRAIQPGGAPAASASRWAAAMAAGAGAPSIAPARITSGPALTA